MTPKRIAIIGYDGVAASDLTAVAAAFAGAKLDDGYGGKIDCYDVRMVAARLESFRSDCGIAFHPEHSFSSCPAVHTVVIPGGAGASRDSFVQSASNWLLHRTEWRRIGTIGSGTMALAAAGLLGGRIAAVEAASADEYIRCFPRVRWQVDQTLVESEPYYSGCGAEAPALLGRAMIGKDYGPALTTPARATAGFAPAPPRPFPVPRASQDNRFGLDPTARLANLMSWILRNMNEDLSLEVLARRASMSPSHFSKVFKASFGSAPTDFVATLRLNEARRQLASARRPIRSVASAIGFTNLGAFNRAFRRRFGVSPGEFSRRRSMRSTAPAAA